MIFHDNIISTLEKHAYDFHPVVDFDAETNIISRIDLSKNNPLFSESVYCDRENFSAFINNAQKQNNAMYLIGGYRERREMYRRSELFDSNLISEETSIAEPRSLHIGTDIWGMVGTKIYTPLGGMIHSFAYNNDHGDYGATIILQHQLDMINFYTLYGHLSLRDIEQVRVGQFITRGENFAHFGAWEENGNWPSHLHFQVILDMGIYEGDYPGVCKMSEANKYLKNGADPDLILQLNKFLLA